MIQENLNSIRQRIARCCEKTGAGASEVTLICVAKEVGVAEIEEVLGLGETNIGENRVQELALKYKVLGDKVVWHLIGHLQTNKVKDAVKICSLIHSVDSARLAREIDKEAGKIGKIQDILIQVNTSGEAAKFGISPDDAVGLYEEIILLPNIRIKGFMTIAPENADPVDGRQCFRALRELGGRINSLPATRNMLSLLSMGMTNDFEAAIEEGSNMIRVGRAIFGERNR